MKMVTGTEAKENIEKQINNAVEIARKARAVRLQSSREYNELMQEFKSVARQIKKQLPGEPYRALEQVLLTMAKEPGVITMGFFADLLESHRDLQ